jgi:hypothetical protein
MRPDSRVRPAVLSDEMRHVCALIDGEISEWPNVTARLMFGFRAYYRKGVIFALLPETRALETPESIAYKLPEGAREGKKWISWETHGPESVHAALALLERAYTAAGQRKARRKEHDKSAIYKE